LDGDALGDVCDDDKDGDGILNKQDLCPFVNSINVTDEDLDGIPNVCDNCPKVKNPSQVDTDKDGFGDICDPDIDNDGAVTAYRIICSNLFLD
jgi:thrombospondin 2/3/4/5